MVIILYICDGFNKNKIDLKVNFKLSVKAYYNLNLMMNLIKKKPSRWKIYNLYPIWRYLDICMFSSMISLFICYLWALYLGHIGLFCDISDLGINLPERILFRFNLSIVGTILILISFPIRDILILNSKKKYKIYHDIALRSQIISGIGIILVGACNPVESSVFHLIAAICAFGGSFTTQFIYNILLHFEYKKKVYLARCIITSLFFIGFIIFILSELNFIPEPAEHILEWSLMFNLVGWYGCFQYDFSNFYQASINLKEFKV